MSERELYPSEKQERFIVRLPDGMRDRIKAAADSNNRSMNAEIVATLEEKYPSEAPDFGKIMYEISELTGAMNLMGERSRKIALDDKLNDFKRRGAGTVKAELQKNALIVTMLDGNIRAELGLHDPVREDPDWKPSDRS